MRMAKRGDMFMRGKMEKNVGDEISGTGLRMDFSERADSGKCHEPELLFSDEISLSVRV